MHPPPADHRGDHLDFGELFRLAREGVAVEDDEVGQLARNEPAAAPLGSLQPGGRDAGRAHGFLDSDPLLGVPGRPLVDRPENRGGYPG